MYCICHIKLYHIIYYHIIPYHRPSCNEKIVDRITSTVGWHDARSLYDPQSNQSFCRKPAETKTHFRLQNFMNGLPSLYASVVPIDFSTAARPEQKAPSKHIAHGLTVIHLCNQVGWPQTPWNASSLQPRPRVTAVASQLTKRVTLPDDTPSHPASSVKRACCIACLQYSALASFWVGLVSICQHVRSNIAECCKGSRGKLWRNHNRTEGPNMSKRNILAVCSFADG